MPGHAALGVPFTLDGPGGSFTVDGETDRPMTILRDRITGQVRGFLRDLSAGADRRRAGMAELLAKPGLDVLFTRGIPDAQAWRRR